MPFNSNLPPVSVTVVAERARFSRLESLTVAFFNGSLPSSFMTKPETEQSCGCAEPEEELRAGVCATTGEHNKTARKLIATNFISDHPQRVYDKVDCQEIGRGANVEGCLMKCGLHAAAGLCGIGEPRKIGF